MTTNINLAADVIDRWTKAGGELNSHVGSPHSVAQALAPAGLLMPDLPKPEQCGDRLIWRVGDGGYVYIKPDGRIATIGVSNPYESPSIAYRHALALISAANHAEQEHADV